jgi:hypothetical protein
VSTSRYRGPDGTGSREDDPQGEAGRGEGTVPGDAPETDDAGSENDSGRDEEGGEDGKDPLRFSRWMKRSTTGSVMTGIAIGLREALGQPRAEAAIVIEADEPEDPDGPIHLHFDPDNPQNTVAVIRVPPSEPGPTG